MTQSRHLNEQNIPEPRHIHGSDLELDRNALTKNSTNQINVFSGLWKQTISVATKIFSYSKRNEAQKEMLTHFALTEQMQELNYHYGFIPALYGYIDLGIGYQYYIVMENIPNGNLTNYIIKNTPFTLENQLNIMAYTIVALNFIHNNDFVHTDLSPNNILLDFETNEDESMTIKAKITDFGSTVIRSNSTTESHIMLRNPTHSGPELGWQPQIITQKFDVFSFGVIAWEILHGTLSSINRSLLLDGQRENLSPDLPEDLKTLIEKCWKQDPAERPSTDDIFDLLKELYQLIGKIDNQVSSSERSFLQESEQTFHEVNTKKEEKEEMIKLKNLFPTSLSPKPSKKAATTLNELIQKRAAEKDKAIKAYGLPKELIYGTTLRFEEIKKRYGQGTYGKVSPGTAIINNKELKVAVKKIDINKQQDLDNALHEACIMHKLAQTTYYSIKIKLTNQQELEEALDKIDILSTNSTEKKCSHIVELLSYCYLENKYTFYIAMELMANKDLDTYIRSSKKPFPLSLSLKIALQLAQGLVILYENDIVHRDIKSGNVLLDESYNAKIADFGFAICSRFAVTDPLTGTPQFLAPETCTEPHTSKSDVFSMALVLYELFLNKLHNLSFVDFCQLRRPAIPASIDPAIAEVIKEGWVGEPRLRLDAYGLFAKLTEINRANKRKNASLLEKKSPHATTASDLENNHLPQLS